MNIVENTTEKTKQQLNCVSHNRLKTAEKMYTNLWIPAETERLLLDRKEAELRDGTEVYIKAFT